VTPKVNNIKKKKNNKKIIRNNVLKERYERYGWFQNKDNNNNIRDTGT
jgi:hypothetical protein